MEDWDMDIEGVGSVWIVLVIMDCVGVLKIV